MATIPEALAVAIQHHREGQLGPAEQVNRQILEVDRHHADAIHGLGVIACQVGKHDAAIAYNLGLAFREQGKLDEAMTSFRRALALEPGSALTLLAFAPHWIWGLRGPETPWYPTMQLFRQPTPGHWGAVIQDVAAELSTKGPAAVE